MNIVDYLQRHGHVGRANAIKRVALACAMHMSIRDVKTLAEEARNNGYFVSYSTDQRTGGIYLCETEAEQILLMTQIRSACLNRLRQYSALKRVMKDKGQGRLFPQPATVDEVFRHGGKR